MKLVFCGTPQFAVPTLEKLISAGHDIALVVTQPDRPQGRGLELAAPPVKQCALKHSLPITQPERIKTNVEFRERLEKIAADAIIVVGYGRIIPPWMLTLPRFGNINLHASLLPKYRGAAPIQWAIAEGEKITGVTTMLLNEGLDTGDILLQKEMPVAPEDTSVTIAPQLAAIGADLMVQTLVGLSGGSIVPKSQDHSRATLAPILKREDGLIDFLRPAEVIVNRLRGFQPWPGAYTLFRGKKLAVLEAKASEESKPHPGSIEVKGGRMLVGCGQSTALELLSVQLEGKKATSAAEFVRGYRITSGEELGQEASREVSS
jgi:methionyl-tRNA formyltransferase